MLQGDRTEQTFKRGEKLNGHRQCVCVCVCVCVLHRDRTNGTNVEGRGQGGAHKNVRYVCLLVTHTTHPLPMLLLPRCCGSCVPSSCRLPFIYHVFRSARLCDTCPHRTLSHFLVDGRGFNAPHIVLLSVFPSHAHTVPASAAVLASDPGSFPLSLSLSLSLLGLV